MIRPRTASLVVALALVVAAAACGGDDSADPPGESGTSTTTTEASEPTGAEDEGTTQPEAEGTTEPEEPEAAGALTDALLTIDDLGDGWVESDEEDVEEGGSAFSSFEDDEACEGGSPVSAPDPVDEAATMFEEASETKVITAVGEFAPGEAEEWMATTFGEMARCAALQTPEVGQVYAVEPIEGLGDEAVAVSISSEVEGEPFMAMGITAVRVGDRIALVGSFADAPDDVAEDALLRKVAARL